MQRRLKEISDLDDGWCRLVARGIDSDLWFGDDPGQLARVHPGLTAALEGLGPTAPRLATPARPVPIAPLSRRAERRLARSALPFIGRQSVRWYTFAEAPASWWIERAATTTDDVRRPVATVLNRPPVDHLEILDVLLNRRDEVTAAMAILDGDDLEDDKPAADDGPPEVPPVVADIVEDALFARGWRLEHPAVRGVLVGPGGERVDALALVAYGDDGTADLTALGNVLRR